MADEDRKQIGLTDQGKKSVARLTDEFGWFDEAQAAGRFALAYAIRAGIELGQTGAPVETRWSPDLFDPVRRDSDDPSSYVPRHHDADKADGVLD